MEKNLARKRIIAAQDGDEDSLHSILKAQQSAIKKIIYHHNINENDAADIAQEVLIKLYRYLGTYHFNCEFSTWLYKVVRNCINTYYQDRFIDGLDDTDCSSLYDADERNPEELLINIELMNEIELKLKFLPTELRDSFVLFYLHELTYEEIAQQMNCPIGTVRSRLSRAKKIVHASFTC